MRTFKTSDKSERRVVHGGSNTSSLSAGWIVMILMVWIAQDPAVLVRIAALGAAILFLVLIWKSD